MALWVGFTTLDARVLPAGQPQFVLARLRANRGAPSGVTHAEGVLKRTLWSATMAATTTSA